MQYKEVADAGSYFKKLQWDKKKVQNDYKIPKLQSLTKVQWQEQHLPENEQKKTTFATLLISENTVRNLLHL